MNSSRYPFTRHPILSAFAVLAFLLFSPTGFSENRTRTTAPRIQFKEHTNGICSFKLQDYEFTKPIESAVVFGVSRIFETYKETFGFDYPEDFKVKVTIFADKDKFLSYQEAHIGQIISQSGYYSGYHMETVVWQNEDLKTMLAVLFHEASHMILRHNVPWCPGWVNEGMSVYFEGLNVIGKNKQVVLEPNRIAWCRHWVKKGFPQHNGHPILLKEYLDLNHEQWVEFREAQPNAAYTIGYSLVYYMMSFSETEKILKELLWDFKRRGLTADSVAVINTHYPGGLKKLEKVWTKWVPRARKYRPLRAMKKIKKENQEPNQTQQPDS